jgi:methyl-accepting chemotaxis protein
MKRDRREQQLRSYIGHLKENTLLCSNTTNEILRYHVQFASLMAQCIDDASKSQYNLKYGDLETTELAKKINKASDSLAINVTEMKDNLDLFVSALEEVQSAVKNEQSLAEQILRWLKSLFKAISSILATVCPPISDLHPSAEPKRQNSEFLVTTLREAAIKFCTADPGAFLEHIILPLQG